MSQQSWGKDKLLRADKVLEIARLVPPLSVSIEGRVVQVVFEPTHRSDAGTNDEWLLFYSEPYAQTFYEELKSLIV